LQTRHPTPEGFDAELPAGQQRWREGGLPFGETQQIGGDPHLPIALVAGADADHRQRELLGEVRG
jgi:hypothetical protein